MSRASAAAKGGKKKGATFTINCGKPVKDKIMEITSLVKFLQERIKVGGKAGALGDSVIVIREKSKIIVNSDSNFSKRKIEAEGITINIRNYVRRAMHGTISSRHHEATRRR